VLGQTSECQVLALYFGGDWCPACRAFLPAMVSAYHALTHAFPSEFEVVYVSSDRDIDDFDERQRTMDWKAVPYADYGGRRTKEALCARFNVAQIPTVVLLHRAGSGAEFTLLPGGDGVGRLSASADTLVAQFPRWKTQQQVLTLDGRTRAKWDRAVSLIVLCEHLSADSEPFRALLRAMTSVVRAYNDELEARGKARYNDRRAGRAVPTAEWPRGVCFFVAPGPPQRYHATVAAAVRQLARCDCGRGDARGSRPRPAHHELLPRVLLDERRVRG